MRQDDPPFADGVLAKQPVGQQHAPSATGHTLQHAAAGPPPVACSAVLVPAACIHFINVTQHASASSTTKVGFKPQQYVYTAVSSRCCLDQYAVYFSPVVMHKLIMCYATSFLPDACGGSEMQHGAGKA